MKSVSAGVAASTGFDVLCHALESYTALPYYNRAAPARPELRPAYQGSNPFSDVSAAHALRLLAKYFLRCVADRGDTEATTAMALAATMAGVGFGSSGVHLAHGCSYAISAAASPNYTFAGYSGRCLVPHGISVVLSAPAVFRATAHANPARHMELARILAGENPPVMVALGKRGDNLRSGDGVGAGNALADQLLRLCAATGVPNGLGALGLTAADAPRLATLTLPQQRVLGLAPEPEMAARAALEGIFADSKSLY